MAIDIVEYIHHLLHRNNVAILPGLGAFIAAPTPAVIDHARGILHPPSKVISFNENLKMNDGYLINHIKNRHGITAQDARAIVENFVFSVQAILNDGEPVLLDKIGKIYNNSQGKIVFEPDVKQNFNPITYGMPDVKYYPIDRRNTQSPADTAQPSSSNVEAIKTAATTAIAATVVNTSTQDTIVPPSESKSESVKTWLPSRKTALMAAGIIGATLLAGTYFYTQKDNADGIDSQVVQVSDSRVNVKPSKENELAANDLALDSLKNSAQNQDNSKENTVLPSEKTETSVPAESPKTVVPSTPKHSENHNALSDLTANESGNIKHNVIFLGSFKSERNASRAARRLKRKGYEVYREKHNGLRRVGTPITFKNDAEKDKKLAKIRRVFGQQCWEK